MKSFDWKIVEVGKVRVFKNNCEVWVFFVWKSLGVETFGLVVWLEDKSKVKVW